MEVRALGRLDKYRITSPWTEDVAISWLYSAFLDCVLTGPKFTRRSIVTPILGDESRSAFLFFQAQVSRTFSCNSAQVPSIASERGDQWEHMEPDRMIPIQVILIHFNTLQI